MNMIFESDSGANKSISPNFEGGWSYFKYWQAEGYWNNEKFLTANGVSHGSL